MPSPADRPCALILAAGNGPRRSGDRALLRIGHHTLIEEHIDAFRRAGVKTIAVVRRDVTPLLPNGVGPVQVVVQLRDDASAFDSLVLGIFALPRSPTFVLSADNDLLGDDTLELLVEAVGSEQRPKAVAPRFQGRPGWPVLLFPEAIDAIVRDAVDPDGIHNLDRLLNRMRGGVQYLDVVDDAVVREFDVPHVLSGRI